MVTDYKINAERLGVFYFLDGLDAAVEDYYELDAVGGSLVNSARRYAVPLIITCRDVIVYLGVEILEIAIY